MKGMQDLGIKAAQSEYGNLIGVFVEGMLGARREKEVQEMIAEYQMSLSTAMSKSHAQKRTTKRRATFDLLQAVPQDFEIRFPDLMRDCQILTRLAERFTYGILVLIRDEDMEVLRLAGLDDLEDLVNLFLNDTTTDLISNSRDTVNCWSSSFSSR
ncbi:hypothetical protein E6O75_ATG00675 [Venturia nashicola]|uniref:Uncharacterized protein n=1 Tax=Venturia nashicola TaxID=86259 RepID=A0A4Z1PUC0_9PEZI|nr:hypothetical protein E6O75_ATG00675 [Venturia nashicola]